MDTIRAKVRYIIYEKEDFKIAKATVGDSLLFSDEITIKGVMDIHVDCEYEFVGEKKKDKYGESFVVTQSTILIPSDVDAIEAYLGSGLVPGISKKTAHSIVKFFGADTLMVLDFSPDRLTEIPGIGKKKAKTITKGYKEQRAAQDIMMFLKEQGIGNAAAVKIYRQYGDESIAKIKANPYILADDINGIGFKKADAVALSLGYERTGHDRIKAGVIYTLSEATSSGHTFLPLDELISKASSSDILGVNEMFIEIEMDKLVQDGDISREDDRIYLNGYLDAEKSVAEILREKAKKVDAPELDFDAIEKENNCTYAEGQKEAIRQALSHKIFVLTGNPGCGKTFTVKGILSALNKRKEKVLLAAPTGRAAKRLSEVTGMEASTIHRLLGFNPVDGFEHSIGNPLQCDTLIVDECSMVGILLMRRLLEGVCKDARIILVGDKDQLPSVEAGCVLKDILDSDLPSVCLTEIFRQAQDSNIVMNAHDVNNGIKPTRTGNDFFIALRSERDDIQKEIIRLVTECMKRGYKNDEVQVLSPMRRTGDPIAASELNKILQSTLNPEGVSLQRGFTTFREGDRVMQMKNNYNMNVFNGDTGIIKSIDTEGDTMEIDMNGEILTYERQDFDELELAYASTIHKSQGSEYPVVIIPVHESHFIMLERNLLYTAITRAKKLCILIGTQKAISIACSKQTMLNRHSYLTERLLS